MRKTKTTIDKLEQLVRENYYEKSAAQMELTSGLMKCAKLDETAKEELERMGITPDMYYKTREDITNRGDRMAAAKYYAQFIDVQLYNMHHTADMLYIIPVECKLHSSVKHIGGSYLLNRRKIERLTKQLQQEQQEEDERLNAIIDAMM